MDILTVFNPQKSKLLVFGSDIQSCVIDNFLSCQPTDKHVGHVIGPSLVDQDITRLHIHRQ